ncbi:MAG TPA: efflux RND transporter periplasmic adaptor subunit [Candidatus Cybelea sp.]
MMDPGRRKSVLIAIGALVLLAAIVGLIGWHRGARSVSVVAAAYAPFSIALPESGVVQYPQLQTMSTQIAGNIGRIFVKAGDHVDAGRLLVTISNPQVASDAQSSGAAYRAASARAQSASATGTSNVVEAQANLAAARARLAQAQQDMANGLQSGLGYGETTAADQLAQANANLATTATTLREARRIAVAYQNLYANKAVSRDQLDQAQAKFEQAQVAYNQAHLARASLGTQLTRSRAVLADNLRSAREGYAQAQAALATAQVESGRGDVAAASAEAARAGSEYAFAREQADAMQVRAPYDAIVLSVATEKNDPLRPLQPGDAIAVGQPLVTLAAHRAFVVRTRVDEQDVINVQLGEQVQITGEDFPGRVLHGHIVEISPIVERSADASASRTVATTIVVDDPPAFLRDGISVDVNILTTDLPHAIVVPADAIGRDGATAYVYVVRNGNAYRQTVRVGPSNDANAVILAGLNSGDLVVSGHLTGLRDGTAVAIAPASSATANP